MLDLAQLDYSKLTLLQHPLRETKVCSALGINPTSQLVLVVGIVFLVLGTEVANCNSRNSLI